MNLFNGGYPMQDDTIEPPEPEYPQQICRICSVETCFDRGDMLPVPGKCDICSEVHILFKVKESCHS